MLESLEKEPKTRVISMYFESIRVGRRFLEISKRVTSQKPLLILKLGRTLEGARASASHTGSMALDDKVFKAACAEAGILRLNAFSELFELPKTFATQPLPKGNRMGILTYTGEIGGLAIDQEAGYGLNATRLMPQTRDSETSIKAIGMAFRYSRMKRNL